MAAFSTFESSEAREAPPYSIEPLLIGEFCLVSRVKKPHFSFVKRLLGIDIEKRKAELNWRNREDEYRKEF